MIATDQWPGWAKALLIAQFALVLAVIVPWLLMWTMCASMAGMQMPGMPMMPGR
jgi:hypothetical protein